MSIALADAAICYDRINHAIIAIISLCLGVWGGSITTMLRAIQLMKFYLCTGWGESSWCIGGDVMRILHGLCQGNGAAPAGWLDLSYFLVTIYKNLGYGTKLESPITKVWLNVMGVLYVDDTDLYIMDECIRSEYNLWQETQGAITSWGKLLLATGGALKPEKKPEKLFLLHGGLRVAR